MCMNGRDTNCFFFMWELDLKISSVYFDSIPAVPELSPNRQFDAARLREMRKRADSASKGKEEAEAIAQECMEDIAEISSGKLALLNKK